jgi:hypothetical protein
LSGPEILEVRNYLPRHNGKTDTEIAIIWTDWRKKRSAKKITEAYAEIVLRVENSQLVHMRSKDPEIIWDTLAQVHHM